MPLPRFQKKVVEINLKNSVEDRTWHTRFFTCDCLIFYDCGWTMFRIYGLNFEDLLYHNKPILNVFCISFWRLFSQISRHTLSKKSCNKEICQFSAICKNHYRSKTKAKKIAFTSNRSFLAIVSHNR